jgi:hypothetical protein
MSRIRRNLSTSTGLSDSPARLRVVVLFVPKLGASNVAAFYIFKINRCCTCGPLRL